MQLVCWCHYTILFSVELKEKILLDISIIQATNKIEKGIFPSTIENIQEFIQKGVEFIFQRTKMSFEKIDQIVKDTVQILKRKSSTILIGEITIDFKVLSKEQRSLDLSGLIADIDSETQKSILYHPNWPKEIEEPKVLFIPKK